MRKRKLSQVRENAVVSKSPALEEADPSAPKDKVVRMSEVGLAKAVQGASYRVFRSN